MCRELKKGFSSNILFMLLFGFTGLSILLHDGAGFIFSLFFISVAALVIYGPYDDKNFLVIALIFAFLVRVALMYILHWQSYREGFGGFISGDSILYSLKALKISLKWQGLPYSSMSDMRGESFGVNIFTYLLAMFYRYFEPIYFNSKLINCYIGSITPIFIYFIGKKIFTANVAKMAYLLASFYPSIVRWSLCNLKDPLAFFLTLSSIYFIFYLKEDKPWHLKFLKLCIAAYFIYLLKDFQIISFCALLGAIVCFAGYKFLVIFKKTGLLIVFFIFLISFGFVGKDALKQKVLRQINVVVKRNTALAIADTGGYRIYNAKFLRETESGILNISTLTKAYLRGLSYFLLSPFPWNIATGNQLVAYPQMVLWYFLLFFAAVGVSEGLRFSRDETVFIVLFILIGVSLWAMTEGNIGAAFRHRDYFSFLIFIYSSAGILNLVGRSRSIKQGTVRT